MLLDKSQLIGLTAPEMTALIGGFRSLGISEDKKGVFTNEKALSSPTQLKLKPHITFFFNFLWNL